MSADDHESTRDASITSHTAQPNQTKLAPQKRNLFSIPPPVKRIFDRCPLVTYPENALPLRAPGLREVNILYVFTTAADAYNSRPSFNPGCLKWQTYLKLSDIRFRTVPSSNHASPSGVLPFLLPASSNSAPSKASDPIASNKLKKWIVSQSGTDGVQEAADLRFEAYPSLVDSSIRKAWLYQLYLRAENAPTVHRLYVESCSSNQFVQMTISYQLRRAAETELVKASASNTIKEMDIMREAGEAFDALSTLLGEDEWFLGQPKATLFDASVFAYTHLILDDNIQWHDNKLKEYVNKYQNLVRHQERILELYY